MHSRFPLRAPLMLPLFALFAVGAPACSSGDDDDATVQAGDDDATHSGDDDASQSGDDDASSPTGDDDVTQGDDDMTGGDDDDTTPPPVAPGAHAWQLQKSEDLLTGKAAQGQLGDFMMANDHVRVVIQNARLEASHNNEPTRDIGWGMFGGNLLDAAPVSPDGTVGQDVLGELNLFFNLSSTQASTKVTIQDDGRKSGTAVVVAEGEDDLFDVIKVDAALGTTGVTLPYDLNENFPLKIRTTYSLAANDRHVHVSTLFTNTSTKALAFPAGDVIDSGGDVEEYIPNPDKTSLSFGGVSYSWGGFGEAPYAVPDFVGFFGNGSTYAYVPPLTEDGALNSVSVTISGVFVSVLGDTSIVDVFSGNRKAQLQVPAQGSAVLDRDIVVGTDIASITDEIYAMRAVKTGSLSGQVTEFETGKPLSHVRVGVVAKSDVAAPVTAFFTGEDGKFACNLPAGNYALVAAQGFDYLQDGRPSQLLPLNFQIKPGQATVQNIELGKPGHVSIEVLDGNLGDGTHLPAQVTLYGAYETPPAAIMDETFDNLGPGVARIVWLEDGQADFDVKPGTYDVVVTRGFEYDDQVFPHVVVPEGGSPVALSATLTRVLDTDGYISADLHVHGINSPDSPVGQEDRIRTFLANGVEVLVATDHDYISDYRPNIDAMGVSPWITTISGEEITTFNLGHFNTFPVVADPSRRNGGALDWADADWLPLDPNTGKPVAVGILAGYSSSEDNLSPSQIMQAIDLSQPGDQVRQINHPRATLMGNFLQVGLDLSKLGGAGETTADPAAFRVAPGTDLFVPEAFSALEVQNGTGVADAVEVMNDWFGMLNLGYKVAGTGSSDTHKQILSTSGYGRTFVAVPDDDAGNDHEDSSFAQTFAQSVNGQRVACGVGLFVTTEVEALDGSKASMGQLVSAQGGPVTLRIRVQAPSWAAFDTVQVFANPVVYANPGNVMTFTSPADLDPVETLLAGQDFQIDTVSVATSRQGGTSRLEALIELPMNLKEDTWVVVAAQGAANQLKPGLNSDAPPFGFTNPVYIDVDGDGKFTAPGSSYVLPAPPPTARKSAVNDPHGHLKWAQTAAAVARAEKAGYHFAPAGKPQHR